MPTGSSTSERHPYRAPWVIFWTAFLLRVAYITIAHTYRITPFNHHFEFGCETGRVAASLASGHGYSSPFSGQTGPTAWMVPGFALLLAGVFKIFGIYSALSAWVILTLNSLFQALTVPLVYELGARFAGRRNALWAAWIWALYPGIVQYGVRWIGEMSLATMIFAAVLVLGMRMRGIGEKPIGEKPPERQRVRDWACFGLLWGILAMTYPTLLLLAPVQGIWILLGLPRRRDWLRGLALALLSAVICSAVATPWVVRNEMVFHAFIPTRGDLGAELGMAWSPVSMGFPWGATVPTIVAAPEHQLYARMGELAYVRMRGRMARQWALQHPAEFWKAVALRFYMFWASVPHTAENPHADAFRAWNYCFASFAGLLGLVLALRRKVAAAGLFAWAVVLIPLTYYFVTVGARFRNPLEPILAVLAVYLFQQARWCWGFTLPGLRRLWPAPGECLISSSN